MERQADRNRILIPGPHVFVSTITGVLLVQFSLPAVALPLDKINLSMNQVVWSECHRCDGFWDVNLSAFGIAWECCSEPKIDYSTVEPLITHTPRWMAQGMGYEGLWPLGGVLRIDSENHRKNYG
jgi:hypothetical protein